MQLNPSTPILQNTVFVFGKWCCDHKNVISNKNAFWQRDVYPRADTHQADTPNQTPPGQILWVLGVLPHPSKHPLADTPLGRHPLPIAFWDTARTEFLTHACENIIFPHPLLRAVTINFVCPWHQMWARLVSSMVISSSNTQRVAAHYPHDWCHLAQSQYT